MVVQGALSEDVAGQEQRSVACIPQGESKISGDALHRRVAETFQALQQDGAVGHARGRGRAQAESPAEFLAIVEAHIGDERQPSVQGSNGLSVEPVLGKRVVKLPPDANAFQRALRYVVRAVGGLGLKHRCAVAVDAGPSVEPPDAGNSAHANRTFSAGSASLPDIVPAYIRSPWLQETPKWPG